jgi:hypothetical protein
MTHGLKRLLVAAVLLGGFLGFENPVASQDAETANTLEVIGTGVVFRDNVARARDDAIEHGLWNAVEESVGQLISPVSVLSHFQLLNDRVYSRTDQFIHDYKVLTESKSGKYYRVVVRVTLLTDILENKLQDIGILMTDRELPSILFLLSEQNVGETVARHSWGQSPVARLPLVVEDRLARYVRDKGFVIVNPGTILVENGEPENASARSGLDDEFAISAAEQTGADVVVFGNATAAFSGNVLGTDMKSVEARLSVRVLKVDNAVAMGSFEASGAAVHANEMVAGTEALAISASNLAADMTRQIAASWGKETRQTVLVELDVRGIREYVDFIKFRRILKNEIRGIKNVYLRGIKAGEAKMDVDLQGDTRTLADELMLKSFEGFGVNIFEVSQNAIKLEFIPKSGVRDALSLPDNPGFDPSSSYNRGESGMGQ